MTYGDTTVNITYGLKYSGVYSSSRVCWATPLILDLNGDGVQTIAVSDGVEFDLQNTGVRQKIGWVSQQDGLLAMDLNGDGVINTGAELFGNNTRLADGSLATDGWSALRDLDSNGDGKVDSGDARFGELLVWVDANSDGITDLGELRTLTEINVKSIALQHNGQIAMQNGNVLQGFSSFTTTDGGSHEIVDAWFQMAEEPIGQVDLTRDVGVNSMNISLADVLAVAPVNAAHTLTVTGDAHDSVTLTANEWVNYESTVTENGREYAVYVGASGIANILLDLTIQQIWLG
jgi:hypothetical protein